MKVKALTNGFMRTKGEWYTVREELKNCYVIETGKTLTCVLKTDFLSENEHEKQLQVKRELNSIYGSKNLNYKDTDSLCVIDTKKLNIKILKGYDLTVGERLYILALLTEVKA